MIPRHTTPCSEICGVLHDWILPARQKPNHIVTHCEMSRTQATAGWRRDESHHTSAPGRTGRAVGSDQRTDTQVRCSPAGCGCSDCPECLSAGYPGCCRDPVDLRGGLARAGASDHSVPLQPDHGPANAAENRLVDTDIRLARRPRQHIRSAAPRSVPAPRRLGWPPVLDETANRTRRDHRCRGCGRSPLAVHQRHTSGRPEDLVRRD